MIYSNYQLTKILENCFQNMNCFTWIKLISVLSLFKYWYFNILSFQLLYLPCHLCQISPWPTETRLQDNSHHVLHRFPYFVITLRPHTQCTKPIKFKSQDKPIKFIIKLYIYIIIPYWTNTPHIKMLGL